MDLSKDTLRHEAIRHRDRIDPGSEDPDEAAQLFFEAIQPKKGQVIASYWRKGKEFDSSAVTERVLKDGLICALPVIQKDSKILKFARWDETVPREKGPFDIQQPVVNEETEWLEPDIVIVPMLAFDRHGHRLGYGGGYYDATLKELRSQKTIVAVGMAYAKQAVLFNLPLEDHDQRLDWIITPHKTHCYLEG